MKMTKNIKNIPKFYHGENSITFSLFDEIDRHQLALMINNNIEWNKKYKINENDIEGIHFFPNFGKKYGYGEPDTIIITKDRAIYVEVELSDFSSNQQIPKPFVKQMNKFIMLANDIKKSSTKKLLEQFKGDDGYKFYGKRKLRSIYQQIKKRSREPIFLVISAGSQKININNDYPLNKIIDCITNKKNRTIGWIGFDKIKKMKGLSKTTKIINYNLNK